MVGFGPGAVAAWAELIWPNDFAPPETIQIAPVPVQIMRLRARRRLTPSS
jgi:hypothetical protein